jgi:nanoRNase/pAp phosphatase (c-di-AMP/oligoRNAs hydrolase)
VVEGVAVNWEETLARSEKCAARVLEVCKRPGRVLVLMQDNPDPDALASAMALRTLIAEHGRKRAVIGFGGVCGRAENRAMMETLRIHAQQLTPEQVRDYDIVCLVDTQPRTGNNILVPSLMPDVVIDHHIIPKRAQWHARFVDIRPEYGATSTILYEYLLSTGTRINKDLATALFYGIQSDTRDLGRDTSPLGTHAYHELFLRADMQKLARIRRAPVPGSYYKVLADSLEGCVVAGKTVIGLVPGCGNAEMVAEVADLLLRLEHIHTTVCYGRCGDKIHISARAVDARSDVSKCMKQAVRRIGTGGGHRSMAGGQVPLEGDPEARLALVRERILKAFAPNKTPRPLLSGKGNGHGG